MKAPHSHRPRSLLMAGAGPRVAAAGAVLALLWLAVGWALGLPG